VIKLDIFNHKGICFPEVTRFCHRRHGRCLCHHFLEVRNNLCRTNQQKITLNKNRNTRIRNKDDKQKETTYSYPPSSLHKHSTHYLQHPHHNIVLLSKFAGIKDCIFFPASFVPLASLPLFSFVPVGQAKTLVSVYP
jgi:hypothetical protein